MWSQNSGFAGFESNLELANPGIRTEPFNLRLYSLVYTYNLSLSILHKILNFLGDRIFLIITSVEIMINFYIPVSLSVLSHY